MKLVTFQRIGSAKHEIGVLQGAAEISVLESARDPAFRSMLSLIDAGPPGLRRAAMASRSSEHLTISR